MKKRLKGDLENLRSNSESLRHYLDSLEERFKKGGLSEQENLAIIATFGEFGRMVYSTEHQGSQHLRDIDTVSTSLSTAIPLESPNSTLATSTPSPTLENGTTSLAVEAVHVQDLEALPPGLSRHVDYDGEESTSLSGVTSNVMKELADVAHVIMMAHRSITCRDICKSTAV